jgi:hypothetical protein
VGTISNYKLNHYDGAQKRCSLKHLEFSFRWHNLQDMPLKHDSIITTKEEIDSIIDYNLNDVLFTNHFYDKCTGKIKQRSDMKSLYQIDFANLSDTSIGTKIIAKLYWIETVGKDGKKLAPSASMQFVLECLTIIDNNGITNTVDTEEELTNFFNFWDGLDKEYKIAWYKAVWKSENGKPQETFSIKSGKKFKTKGGKAI